MTGQTLGTNARVNRRSLLGKLSGAGLALGAISGEALAQQPFKQRGPLVVQRNSITQTGALALVAAAVAKANEIGVSMSIAVVDESGLLKAFTRMDGASPASIDIVQKKAYTALSFRTATQAFAQRLQEQPTQIASFTTTPRVTLLPGGLPINVGGTIVGAIGVGGGSGDQDVLVAESALAAVL